MGPEVVIKTRWSELSIDRVAELDIDLAPT